MACKRSDVTFTEVAYSLLAECCGPQAADRRSLGVSHEQQETSNVEGSKRFTVIHLGCEECASRSGGHSTLVQIAVRRDPAPMDEARAPTSASISELRGFTAIAHYYPVGGVS